MSDRKPLGSNLRLVLMSVILHPNLPDSFKINLAPLVAKFKLTKTITGKKFGKDIKEGDVKITKQSYYNCIQFTIRPKPSRRVAVKLFNNLVIHAAGLKSMYEADRIAQILYYKIIKHNMIPELKHDIAIDKHEIILMNSGFNANTLIDRKKMTKICTEKLKMTAFFVPNSYSGVKFYPEDDITLLIFRTGKISVTGARSFRRLLDGYFLMEKILRKYYNEIQ